MTSPRKKALRVSLTLAGLVMLGAVTTVAVAWGCERFNGRPIPRRTPDTHAWAPAGTDEHVAKFSITRNGWGSESRNIVTGVYNSCDVRPDSVVFFYRGLIGWKETLPRVFRSPVPIACSDHLAKELQLCVVDLAGWPWHSLCKYGDYEDQPSRLCLWTVEGINLPLDPIWPGFPADTATYAVAWWLLLLAPRRVRRALRRRGGRCVKCGYDLAGLAMNAACPECGRARDVKSA